MSRATAGLRELLDLVIIDMNGVRKPHVIAEPVERFHPIHRPQTEALQRVAFFIQRLAEMRVKLHAVLPRHGRRVFEQARGHRKRRAGSEDNLRHGAGRGVVMSFDHALAVLHDEGFIFDAVIGRQAALGFAQ